MTIQADATPLTQEVLRTIVHHSAGHGEDMHWNYLTMLEHSRRLERALRQAQAALERADSIIAANFLVLGDAMGVQYMAQRRKEFAAALSAIRALESK